MGFSVTAAHVVFALAMLTAFSVAAGSYWQTQEHLAESRRLSDERVIDAAQTNLTLANYQYNSGSGGRLTFDLENTGSVVLDHTEFAYLLDGVIGGTMAAGYPLIDGAATTSSLLLPGEVLTVRLAPLSPEPANVLVVAENGITTHHP